MDDSGNFMKANSFLKENPTNEEIADVIRERLNEFDHDAQCYISGTTTDRRIQCEYRYDDIECHCTIRRQNDGKFKTGYALFGNGSNNTYERIDDNAEALVEDVCSLVNRHYNEYHPNNQQNNNQSNSAQIGLGILGIDLRNLFHRF